MIYCRQRVMLVAVFSLLTLLNTHDERIHAEDFNSIEREHDILVLKGEELTSFLGKPVSQIRVYRFLAESAQWEPIPYQVDELDGGDSYFGQKNGILDANDEIVFLAKDLGDSVSPTNWVYDEEARESVRYQISVEDPISAGQRGWVSVYFSSTLQSSGESYVQYFAGQDRVETEIYEIDHGNSGVQESLILKSSAGGDNIDFLDRQKLRVRLRLDLGVLGSKEITLKEEMDEDVDIISGIFSIHVEVRKKRVDVVEDCVVRLHRNMTLEVVASGPGIDDIVHELPFATTYYPTYAELKTGAMKIPEIKQGDITADVKVMRLSTDLNENSYGMRFTNLYNPDGITIDLLPDEGFVDTLNWPGQNWYLIAADPDHPNAVLHNASIVTLIELKGDPPGGTTGLYYKDYFWRDMDDTGDKLSYGDTGVQVAGDKLSGYFDFYSATYTLPANLDTSQARDLFTKHFHPLHMTSQEERLLYALSAEVSPAEGGSVELDPPGELVLADSVVVLTAIPNPGFAFDHWSGDLSGTENPIALLMDGPKNVTAHFAHFFEITVNTGPTGLTFTADSVEYSGPTTFTWNEGSSHSLCVDSTQGEEDGMRFRFSSWSDGGNRCHDYVVPGQAEEIIVHFTKQYCLEIAENPEDAGDVIPTPPGDWYDEGSMTVVEAYPTELYTFLHWSGDLTGSENPDSLLMNGPKSITAHFGNFPPFVDAPDTSFAEDDTLILNFQEILRWVTDDNNSDSTLSIDVAGGDRLDVMVDSTEERVRITNNPSHWNGVDTVIVIAADPLGASGQDKMVITVTPVPDPPGSFSLLTPSDSTRLVDMPGTIHFSWETSYDPDEGDTITYVFELDTTLHFDSGRLIRVDTLEVTEFVYPWPSSWSDGLYYWRVEASDGMGNSTPCEEVFVLHLATEQEESTGAPTSFVLDQNYPNPFNQETEIRFGMPFYYRVSIVIYNSTGQMVKTLVDGDREIGYHTVKWDGRDDRGARVSSGLYFVLLLSDASRVVKKAVLIR